MVGSTSQQQWLERDVEVKGAKPSVTVMPIVRQDSVGVGLTVVFDQPARTNSPGEGTGCVVMAPCSSAAAPPSRAGARPESRRPFVP